MPDLFVAQDGFMKSMASTGHANWDDARDLATAGSISTNSHHASQMVKVARSSGAKYFIHRTFFAIDTSTISVKPSSAILKIVGKTYKSSDFIVMKVNAGAAGGKSAAWEAADFDQVAWGTAYSAVVDVSEDYTVADDTTYNEITLNDAALQDMADLSDFKFCVVDHTYDYNDTAPSVNGTNLRTGGWLVTEEGTGRDPKISYVEGSATTFTESTPVSLIADDFTINSVAIDALSVQYERSTQQVPFTLGVPGPLSLRKRGNAPSAKQGDKKN